MKKGKRTLEVVAEKDKEAGSASSACKVRKTRQDNKQRKLITEERGIGKKEDNI